MSGSESFKYDPFGRRIYKSSSSGTSIFAYDGDNLVEEVNSSGAVVARYAQQGFNIDEPLAMLRSATTSFYEQDGLGTVTSLSSSAGALAQTYTFDSFGKQTASSGSLTNPFQYTAREFDAETSLYFYRARYYDSGAGRFLSEDPVQFGAGPNFYAYVQNGATNWNDPFGLCRVVVLYFHMFGKYHHAALLVSNNTGGPRDPLIYRGRPGRGPGNSTVLESIYDYPALDPFNPDLPKNVVAAQVILDDQSDCKCIIGKLDDFSRRVNASVIPYRLGSTNSNAYASGAIDAAGLPLPTPPVTVKGWGVPLPISVP